MAGRICGPRSGGAKTRGECGFSRIRQYRQRSSPKKCPKPRTSGMARIGTDWSPMPDTAQVQPVVAVFNDNEDTINLLRICLEMSGMRCVSSAFRKLPTRSRPQPTPKTARARPSSSSDSSRPNIFRTARTGDPVRRSFLNRLLAVLLLARDDTIERRSTTPAAAPARRPAPTPTSKVRGSGRVAAV